MIGKSNSISTGKADQSGSVLIELAIILPLILVITLTSFEFTRAIHKSSIAASAGKEMASIILRQCNSTNYNTCVNQVHQNFEDFLQSVAKGIRVRINYARFSPGQTYNGFESFSGSKGAYDTWGSSTDQDGAALPAGKFSKFISESLDDENDGTDPNKFSDMDRLGEIFMIEVYIPYSPVLIFTNSIFPFPIENGLLYDATII